jgi:hypothetical protein
MRVIRPIANLNCDGARVSGISRAVVRPWTTIIGSVPRISSISSFTSACTERDRNQKQQQCRPFQSRFCSRSCGECFRLRMFNNIRYHNNGIRIRVSFHAPPRGRSVNFPQAGLHGLRIAVTINMTQQNPAMVYLLRRRVTRHPGRASHLQLLRIRQCSRRLQDCPGARTRQQCPMRSCGLSS